MKRMVVISGVLAGVATACIASQVWAQPGATGSRGIAFVNIVTVFQKYEKAKFLKAEMETKLEPFKAEAKKLNEEAEKWRDWVQKNPNLSAADKDKAQNAILARKRRLEDINREVSKLVGQQNEQQVIQLYKEVNDAVKGYALANGYSAVLAYGDADATDPELYSFANISRKVQGMEMGGGVTPMYMAPGLDISSAVVQTLNAGYRPVPVTPVSNPGFTPKQ